MQDKSLIQGLRAKRGQVRRERVDVGERVALDGLKAEGEAPDPHLRSVRSIRPGSAGRNASLAAAAALIGLVNFLAFLHGTLWIGGDATNGVVVAGHYFVANSGIYTEVSKAVYDASLWHVHNIILMFPLAMFGMIYFALKATIEILGTE